MSGSTVSYSGGRIPLRPPSAPTTSEREPLASNHLRSQRVSLLIRRSQVRVLPGVPYSPSALRPRTRKVPPRATRRSAAVALPPTTVELHAWRVEASRSRGLASPGLAWSVSLMILRPPSFRRSRGWPGRSSSRRGRRSPRRIVLGPTRRRRRRAGARSRRARARPRGPRRGRSRRSSWSPSTSLEAEERAARRRGSRG